MDENTPLIPLPAEELARCQEALREARLLPRSEGREVLAWGLERALRFQQEAWGPELIRVWLGTIRHWDRQA